MSLILMASSNFIAWRMKPQFGLHNLYRVSKYSAFVVVVDGGGCYGFYQLKTTLNRFTHRLRITTVERVKKWNIIEITYDIKCFRSTNSINISFDCAFQVLEMSEWTEREWNINNAEENSKSRHSYTHKSFCQFVYLTLFYMHDRASQ